MRCNVGVDPKYLTDQHLIAEYRELPMVLGSLRINKYKIVGEVPKEFPLGKGHMNFFKDKLVYLYERYIELKKEITNRGFQNNLTWPGMMEYPDSYKRTWKPSQKNTELLRSRIVEKINMKPTWYKYYSKPLTDDFIETFINSPLYKV